MNGEPKGPKMSLVLSLKISNPQKHYTFASKLVLGTKISHVCRKPKYRMYATF